MENNSGFVYMQDNYLYDENNNELFEMVNRMVSCVDAGDHVVIKPNFVRQCSLNSKEWEHIITNPVLIKMVLKAVVSKLDGGGSISILDAPQEDSDFECLIKNIGLVQIVNDIQNTTTTPISIIDIRTERKKSVNGVIVSSSVNSGDPLGYVRINLSDKSSFDGKASKAYYGADYNIEEARNFHNDENNTYVISKSVLDSNVFINMPKLKTHKIGGMTCCLKNAVGIIGVKNCIPHHTIGTPLNNGDATPHENAKNITENRLKCFARKLLRTNNLVIGYAIAAAKVIISPIIGKNFTVIRNGHWYGNDTLWRAILDLNKILLYSDKDGVMQQEQQRKYIAIIDGIVAGEKNGPMAAEPKMCGLVGFFNNALIADTVMSRLMGFDYKKIPSIYKGYELTNYKLSECSKAEDIIVRSNYSKWDKPLEKISKQDCMSFQPAFGWEGHIELK